VPVAVPFHLIRSERKEAGAAFLLCTDDIAELLTLCGRIGADPLPPIFPVEGGFLIIPESAPAISVRNALPLRRLSENFWLAVDAELVPALHSDEAAALTRERGLVFLPGNRCLQFDAQRPLAATALIEFPPVKRANWQPFPDAPDWPERLKAITYSPPGLTPDDVLAPGGDGIGEEAPRPPKANPVKTALGKAGLGLGKGIAVVGTILGIGAVGRLGASLMAAALAMAPRLSESLLGRQEAALRELLRKFREGRIEEALKNALPLGGENSPGDLHSSDQLPTHNVRWSLANIFGGGGRASLWVGGADEQRQLADEYRKAAQAALARGDYRRAAFIYAKLLYELRTAADILSQGGLHRDAAILYRDLIKDPRWAAREFEAAGDCDEALRLFRQIGEFEQAGDLLRRMGEEDEAVEEYHRAARQHIERQADYLKAGELMLRKTGRADLAGAYFAIGWRERSVSVNLGKIALPCAIRLAEILAFAEPLDPFWGHFQEVESWLETMGHAVSTASFFNVILKLAELPHLHGARAELRDRSRLALAAKLRDHAKHENRPGNAVSDLFGGSRHWAAAVVSDADFALRTALKAQPRPPAEKKGPFPIIAIGTPISQVTATATAPTTGEIVIGFQDGSVVCLDPRTQRVDIVAPPSGDPVEAIAVDESGHDIVAASGHDPESGTVRLRSYRRDDSPKVVYRSERIYHAQALTWYVLNPLILKRGFQSVLLSTPVGIVEFRAAVLIPGEPDIHRGEERAPIYLTLIAPLTAKVVSSSGPIMASSDFPPDYGRAPSSRIIFHGNEIVWTGLPFHVGWRPRGELHSLSPLSWLQTANNRLEVAGVSDDGRIRWSEVVIADGDDLQSSRTCVSDSDDYCAVAIWKPGVVVAATKDNRICWLRSFRLGFCWVGPQARILDPNRAVACFASRATGEAIVILANGEAVCVPAPS
jgi:tetratricopeptide (TPR) repeat protein